MGNSCKLDVQIVANSSTKHYQLTDKYINPIKKKKLINKNVNASLVNFSKIIFKNVMKIKARKFCKTFNWIFMNFSPPGIADHSLKNLALVELFREKSFSLKSIRSDD